MASTSTMVIDAELYRLAATGDVNGLVRAITTNNNIDILTLQSARDGNTVLHIAASLDQVGLVKEILSRWPQLMVKGNIQEDLPIHSALKTGKLASVEAITSWLVGNDDVACRVLGWTNTVDGNTPLHIALEYDQVGIARNLVDLHPCGSYVMNNKGICPLFLAINKDLVDLVQHMLHKLQPFRVDALHSFKEGASILHAAVSARSTDMLEEILSYDEELINLLDNEGRTAQSYAAHMNYVKQLQIFLTKIPDSTFICNKDKSFPIHLAVLGAHLNIIDLLANTLLLLNDKGQNILHLATMTGDPQLVSHILKLAGVEALISQKDEDGNTPLHLATLIKNLEVVETLVHDKRVDATLSNKEGLTAKEMAKKMFDTDANNNNVVLRLNMIFERATHGLKCFPMDCNMYHLLLRGEIQQVCRIISDKKVHLIDLVCPEDGNTILHVAATLDQPLLIVDLLQRGCDILMEQVNYVGDLPIHSASKVGNMRSLKALFQWSKNLSHGTSIHICERQNREGNTALHAALQNKHVDIAKYLYKQCPQAAYSLNKNNICPLFLAIENLDQNELVETMINGLSGNLQIQNQLKFTRSIVHLAIFLKNKAVLDMIIEKAPGLMESFDSRGRNPLSYAAHIGYAEGVSNIIKKYPELLYKRDKDEDGSFPIHQAAKGRTNMVIVKLLHPHLCLLNNKGQNILHVAAHTGKYHLLNNLLKMPELKALFNTRDVNGDTPLHLAVKGIYPRSVYFLITQQPQSYITNNNELLTARDIFEVQRNSELANRLFLEVHLINLMLKNIGAKTSILNERNSSEGVDDKRNDNVKERASMGDQSPVNTTKKAETFLLVATLCMTVTFSAVFNPPGGYKQDDSGQPALSANLAFKWFKGLNLLAFFVSTVSALYLITGINVPKMGTFCVLVGGYCMLWGLVVMMLATLISYIAVFEKPSDSSNIAYLLRESITYVVMYLFIGSLPILLNFMASVSPKRNTLLKICYISPLLFFCRRNTVKCDFNI